VVVAKRLLIRATGHASGTITYGEIEIEREGKVSGVIQEAGPIPYTAGGSSSRAMTLGNHVIGADIFAGPDGHKREKAEAHAGRRTDEFGARHG
jgi:hypothetical protein